MTDAEIATVSKLISLCRKEGVTELEVGGCRLKMGSPAGELKPSDAKDAEQCKCNHPLHAHNNGMCLLGCPSDECLGTEAM